MSDKEAKRTGLLGRLGAPVLEPTDASAPARRAGWRKGLRWFLVVIVAAMFAMWVYAFMLGNSRKLDRLDDVSIGPVAEKVCAPAQTAIAALPAARTARSPQDRATMIDSANGILQRMLDELHAEVHPTSPRDQNLFDQWLTDWNTFLGDRKAYAATLASGKDARFSEHAYNGEPITLRMDDFASRNDMPSCTHPYDVG